MFDISLLNPLRFIDTSDINYSFDGNFAIDRLLSYQNPKCYFQKWQHSDTLYLQIISDFVPEQLQFRSIETGAVVDTAEWADLQIPIIDFPDAKVYQLDYAFTGLPSGKYYVEFSYTDEGALEHVLISEPICVQQTQDNTLLIKYTHHENDFDIIFSTNIEFEFRVEAAIKNFNPKNARSVYTDQKINSTQLSATPYRTFKLFIGFKYGVPEWVFDKINWIQSVDQVKYNDVYYQVINDAEYEIEANDDNSFIGGSIDVQPVNNNFSKYKTGPSGGGNLFIPMDKELQYFNVAGNFPIAGIFRDNTVLQEIYVKKRSFPDILLKVGTTPGGEEIGEFTVDDPRFAQTIKYYFDGTSIVYLTGLDAAGTDCDVFVTYRQLDEEPIDLGGGSGNTPPPLGKGAKVEYVEIQPGDRDLDFDMATGLGRANTPWAGWARAGTNGTPSMGGLVPVGYDPNDPEFDEIGSTGGAKEVVLTAAQLPKIEVKTNGVGGIDGNPNGGGLGYANNPKDKLVFTFGENAPHPNMQPYRVAMWVIKIV